MCFLFTKYFWTKRLSNWKKQHQSVWFLYKLREKSLIQFFKMHHSMYKSSAFPSIVDGYNTFWILSCHIFAQCILSQEILQPVILVCIIFKVGQLVIFLTEDTQWKNEENRQDIGGRHVGAWYCVFKKRNILYTIKWRKECNAYWMLYI